MKTMHLHHTLKTALLAGLLASSGAFNSPGQFTFSSGSDGSYGLLNITTNTTLAMPANGIFNCTTITIASNATLKFIPNALNTPVYLLAQGDVAINGTIDVSGFASAGDQGGAGGPGGFAGGNGIFGSLPNGDGHGPGAGRRGVNSANADGAGGGAYGRAPYYRYYTGNEGASSTTNQGALYGSPLLVPLVGGSGSGASDQRGGTGGGGAILIASSTRVDMAGMVVARGGSASVFGLGSGGAIRLVSPIVAGSGVLNVLGGEFVYSSSQTFYGGTGRIRVDCMDRRAFRLALSGVATLGANMVAIPTSAPHLDITQVGTSSIPVGTGAPVFFTLPQDSSTNQTVTVQASNFGGNVSIRVVLTPDNGPSSSYDTNIDNTLAPASVTVPVVVPVNVQVQVNAWTR